ncbi:MAG: type IV pili methyl-accepting chemotaxis transducer N-terminal domain-containing protein [Kangiellaceae bacterium]|nr:type IV pili methyl-accepting chemotaxis transducer N-terminal domain-containing protein [Kangiellaceae bacterium]
MQLKKKIPNSKYISLVARAGMVMAIIVALAMASLMSSMFVSESLDGDAAQINIAGSLRMQSIRLSRALTAEQNDLIIYEAPTANDEIIEFERRLQLLLNHGLISQSSNQTVTSIHHLLEKQWKDIKEKVNQKPVIFKNEYSLIDEFVETIDHLVMTLQHDSEQKIKILRMIQGGALFLTLLTAFIALYRINKTIVQPMNNLVSVAKQAGKGDFSVKVKNVTYDEIGLLGLTFNDMSEQLQIMHSQLEEKVKEKTFKLQQSNKSLELLYQTSHNLVRPNKRRDFESLLHQVELTLGKGQVVLCLDRAEKGAANRIPISQHSLPRDCDRVHCEKCSQPNKAKHVFIIHKQGKDFGTLQYFNDDKNIEQWQSHLLQTIADNIAVAISLDKKRSQENLLLLMEERAVIARELHDSLAQSLSYLKLQTSLLNKQIEKDSDKEQVDNTIDDLKEGLNNAYRQLRELLTTFRLQIDEPSLESALKGTVVEFSSKCQHPIELEYLIANHELSSNQQIHVLQIVREALSNVQRHAEASFAQVRLFREHRNIKVQIIDNGLGVPDKIPEGSHYGLSIMNERAASLDAKLEIKKNQPNGTIVEMLFEPNTINL